MFCSSLGSIREKLLPLPLARLRCDLTFLLSSFRQSGTPSSSSRSVDALVARGNWRLKSIMHRSVSWALLSFLCRLGLPFLGGCVFFSLQSLLESRSIASLCKETSLGCMDPPLPLEFLEWCARRELPFRCLLIERRPITVTPGEGETLPPISRVVCSKSRSANHPQTFSISRGYVASSSGQPLFADREGDAPRGALDKRLDHAVGERENRARRTGRARVMHTFQLFSDSSVSGELGVIDLRYSSSSFASSSSCASAHVLPSPLLCSRQSECCTCSTLFSAPRSLSEFGLAIIFWFCGSWSARLKVMVMNGAGRTASRASSVGWQAVRAPPHHFFGGCLSSLARLFNSSFPCSPSSKRSLLAFSPPLLSSPPPSLLPLVHLLGLTKPEKWNEGNPAWAELQQFNQSQFFYSGHDPITHVRRARHLTVVETLSEFDIVTVIALKPAGRPVSHLRCCGSCGRSTAMAYILLQPHVGCTDFWFCQLCRLHWMDGLQVASVAFSDVFCISAQMRACLNVNVSTRCAPLFYELFCASGLRPLAWRCSFFLCVWTLCDSLHGTAAAQNQKVPSKGRRTRNEGLTSSAAFQEMRCSVRSERQVAILATGLLRYWWEASLVQRPQRVSVLRVLCLFLRFQRLTRSFCLYLYEDLECASAVPSGFGGSFTHIGDHPSLFLRGVRSPFLGS